MMNKIPIPIPIPMEHGLIIAVILFFIGATGLLVRRNLLFVLMCLEILMNSVAIAFVVAGAAWENADGQVMFILIITLAAAEASIGLALIIQLHRNLKTIDVDAVNGMKG